MTSFKFFKQPDQMDCGPTCLRMVARHHGRNHSTQRLRELTEIGKDGVNMLGIAEAAEKIGFRASGVKLNLQHWLEVADVKATPTSFVKGFRLPESYSLSDIRYLIAEVE